MAEGEDVVTGRPNGSERSQQIAADIDRTRASVDRTIDALVGKLTPQQLLMELAGVMRSGTSTLATSVLDTARQHPVPATIIGLGLGMIILERSKRDDAGASSPIATSVADTAESAGTATRDALHRVEEKAAHATEKIGEKVGEVTHRVGEKVGEVGHQVREKVDQAREGVHDAAVATRDRVAQVKTQARQQVKKARLGFWQTMEKEPLAVGAAAVAIGIVAGLSLPRTEKEDDLMGETRDRLMGDARERGREMLHKGQAVAKVAAETIRAQAEREGLTPSAVGEKIRQAGEQTADKVRGIAHEATETIRQEAARQHLVPQGGAAETASHQSWNQGGQTWDRPPQTGADGGTQAAPAPGVVGSTSGTTNPSPEDKGGSGA